MTGGQHYLQDQIYMLVTAGKSAWHCKMVLAFLHASGQVSD